MAQLFLNNCYATLDQSALAADTSLVVSGVSGFPGSLASGDFFLLTLFADTTRYGENIEVVKVTGLADNGDGTWSLTVERGVEGAALDHTAGEKAEARLTAGSLGSAVTYHVPASGNAGAGEVVLGNDTRLSDARTPTSHNHSASEITSGTLSGARLPHATSTAVGGVKVRLNGTTAYITNDGSTA